MSVLQLRRDMVVVEDEPVVEIEAPFPLRTIDAEAIEIHEADNDADEKPRRSWFGLIRFWFKILIVVAVLGAYPALIVMGSDVGDRNVSSTIDRSKWSAPWAGGVATLLEEHINELGWASDSPSWSPMARLTAKPAYQSAMAGALGEYLALANSQSVANREGDPDISAAARLVSSSSTAIQLRAARDALVNYDRRLRRRGAAVALTPAQLAEQLALVDSWAAKSQADLARTADLLGGSPIDEAATVAVYSTKGRSIAAFSVIDAMQWPDDPKVAAARNATLKAWKAAAEFHPMIVFNGSPDGSLLGNHAAAMGFLIGQAQKATEDYKALLGVPAPAMATANAGTFSALK